ncbi:MAG: hypothetical protein K2O92_09490 [Lachnospiraceae bacterium]|nr:hypothetical protein [Lachnospiraceae bacterium]
MVNEEKTRIMIKIAQYESELGGKVINEGGYYKTDYVRLHTLSLVLNISVAYIFVLALIALYNMDYIFLNFVTINYAKLFIEIFMPYISIIIICTLVSNIYFTSKYKSSREEIKKYYTELKRLEQYYTDSGKETADDTVTGV